MASLGLALLYDRCVTASRAGDAAAAYDAFMQAVGLRPRRRVERVPTRMPAAVPMLQYRRPRRIDLIALTRGARDVAKFEDLSLDDAERLRGSLERTGLHAVRVGPYGKRFDVALSGGDGALYTIIASRGRQAAAVAEAERDRSGEGTRRAGLALGYPRCCVERFVELESSAAALQDGINEAALRAIYGGGGAIPWQLNPLSSLSPVGFVPCRADCPAALLFAERMLDAAAHVEPGVASTLRQVLARPILFFRHPFFFVLADAAADGDGARYRAAYANDDGAGLPSELAAWQEDELGAPLAAGHELRLDAATLRVEREGAAVAEWRLSMPTVPMLLRFDASGER